MDSESSLNFEEEETATDSSFPQTFASYFANEFVENFRTRFNEIGNTWITIGLPISQRDEEIANIRTTILETVAKIATEQDDKLTKLRAKRDYKLSEINKILKALSLETYNVDSSKSLLTQNKILDIKFREMAQIKSERIEHLGRIVKKLQKACRLLGIVYDEPFFATCIPSENELMCLRSKLMEHEQTIDKRKKLFESLKTIIVKYKNNLDYLPQSSEELMLLDSDDIVYSEENMTQIADLHKKILQLYNIANSEIENLKYNLTKLFNRLDVDEITRKTFFCTLTGSLHLQKRLLVDEIDKYEVLKKSCMEKIIKSLRQDINGLYRKCRVCVFQDSILESENFTEDLLNEHEKEFSKLKLFHQHYSEVLIKLNEWEESIGKLFELEKKSLDPNRFNNRGAALLNIEQSRRQLTKKLPRLEKEIKSLITIVATKENIPFDSFGFDIQEFFSSNWSSFRESKDAQKTLQTQKISQNSSKKIIALSSQKKSRYPLSPRVGGNNFPSMKTRIIKNPMASKKLFTPTDSGFDSQSNFVKGLEFAISDEPLHSTLVHNENFDKYASQFELCSPQTVNRFGKLNRRRSRSYGDLANKADKQTYGITARKNKK